MCIKGVVSVYNSGLNVLEKYLADYGIFDTEQYTHIKAANGFWGRYSYSLANFGKYRFSCFLRGHFRLMKFLVAKVVWEGFVKL